MDKDSITMERRLSIRIPAELHDKARAKSQETGITIAFIVRKALERWVESDPNHAQAGNH